LGSREHLVAGIIGEAFLLLASLAVLVLLLRARLTPFKKKLEARRAQEREAKRRRDSLEESVRMHLLPALIGQGFEPAPPVVHSGPVDRDYLRSFPSWGKLIRAREPVVDLVEIQFSSHGRAAFRINACAVPKDGMMTAGGHQTAEKVIELGVTDLETHARPWLRPGLRALGLEPLGAWFSVGYRPLRAPTQTDYDRLALQVAGLLPELELALREGKLGTHIRRLPASLFKPLPPEVLDRIERIKAQQEMKK
jgi:hypothetical protein